MQQVNFFAPATYRFGTIWWVTPRESYLTPSLDPDANLLEHSCSVSSYSDRQATPHSTLETNLQARDSNTDAFYPCYRNPLGYSRSVSLYLNQADKQARNKCFHLYINTSTCAVFGWKLCPLSTTL